MKLFDFDSALERFMGEREILIDVLPAYIENLENTLLKLEEQNIETDCVKIRELAHSIKGSSLNLDIIPLGKEAENLENLAYNSKKSGIPESLSKVKYLAAQTIKELQTYLD